MAVKADASGGGTMDKVLTSLDALHTRMDAMELSEGSKDPLKSDAKKDARGKADDDDDRKDAEEEEKEDSRKDEEEEEEKKDSKKDARKDQIPPRAGTGAAAPPVVADKKKDKRGDDDDDDRKDSKKDARGRGDDDDDDDDDRKDSKKDSRADAFSDMQRQLKEQADIIKRLEGRFRPVTDEEHYQFAEAQAKADSVFQGFGERAPRPLEGESLIRYRKRLATHLKKHSADWKNVKFSELPEPAFAIAEQHVYADALEAAAHPVDLEPGEMRPVETTSSSGHRQLRQRPRRQCPPGDAVRAA
jgi:hypothetical protein